MARYFLIIAGVAGASGVALGAIGAHQMRDILSPARFETYLTGVRYLLVHSVVLFIAARMAQQYGQRILIAACYGFFLGMIAFSGSLIFLGLYGIRILGAVAPIGGAAYIFGWLALGWGAWRATGVEDTSSGV